MSSTCTLIGDSNLLFIEEGATVECATLNTKNGPIYIGKDAEIMETCAVRGPLAMCEHAVLNMGTKVYGPTTLGPLDIHYLSDIEDALRQKRQKLQNYLAG